MRAETIIAVNERLPVAQVSSDGLVDIVNDSIIALAVVLPAVAVAVAVLDAVNTPAIAAVTSFSLATTFLAGGVVFAVLAVAFGATAFVADLR